MPGRHRLVRALRTPTNVAYNENQGDADAQTCTNANKPIDLNTLTYIAVRELAHIACGNVGHTNEFWGGGLFDQKFEKKPKGEDGKVPHSERQPNYLTSVALVR